MFNTVTCLLKTKIAKPAETAVAINTSVTRQRSINSNNETAHSAQSEPMASQVTIKELCEEVFYMPSVPRCYNEVHFISSVDSAVEVLQRRLRTDDAIVQLTVQLFSPGQRATA
jgi:hypothetical protein